MTDAKTQAAQQRLIELVDAFDSYPVWRLYQALKSPAWFRTASGHIISEKVLIEGKGLFERTLEMLGQHKRACSPKNDMSHDKAILCLFKSLLSEVWGIPKSIMPPGP